MDFEGAALVGSGWRLMELSWHATGKCKTKSSWWLMEPLRNSLRETYCAQLLGLAELTVIGVEEL